MLMDLVVNGGIVKLFNTWIISYQKVMIILEIWIYYVQYSIQ